MKYIYMAPLLVLFTATTVQSSEVNFCNVKRKSDCEVVRVVTRCDVDKQRLRNKIAYLEKRVLELETTLKLVQQNKPVERYVYVNQIVHDTVVRKESSHFILGLYAVKDITGSSTTQNGNSVTAEVDQSYVPGIKLQYMFSFGLVPEIGINAVGSPMFGLGWKF